MYVAKLFQRTGVMILTQSVYQHVAVRQHRGQLPVMQLQKSVKCMGTASSPQALHQTLMLSSASFYDQRRPPGRDRFASPAADPACFASEGSQLSTQPQHQQGHSQHHQPQQRLHVEVATKSLWICSRPHGQGCLATLGAKQGLPEAGLWQLPQSEGRQKAGLLAWGCQGMPQGLA